MFYRQKDGGQEKGDASIVAAAEYAKCHAILSEDLNEGQYYAGIPVINPLKDGFAVHPAEPIRSPSA